MENNDSSDYQFITEHIKDKPLDRRKLTERIILGILAAAIFGAVAALVFVSIVKRMVPEIRTTVVSIPLDRDPAVSGEEIPEKTDSQPDEEASSSEKSASREEETEEAGGEEEGDEAPEETSEEITAEVSDNSAALSGMQGAVPGSAAREPLTTLDYRDLYRSLRQAALDMEKSIVTVTVTASGQDWFDNPYTNTNQVAGLIVANNGRELLILADRVAPGKGDALSITFSDGTSADASIKEVDGSTGLVIIGVEMQAISEETREKIAEAKLGTSSLSTVVGQPVMAVGMPFGTVGSQAFGLITSNSQELSLTDRNLHVLGTNIYGSTAATGVIATFEGEVLGIVTQQASTRDTVNLLTAYSISDLKGLIEKLSNGTRPARLGIHSLDVTEEVHEKDGIPFGAFITSVDMDSPAMDAGIQSGDIITKIGTQNIGNCKDYTEAIMKCQPGDQAVVTVNRFGQNEFAEMTFDVTFDTNAG